MTKADLRPGMIVTCRNGRRYLLIDGMTTGDKHKYYTAKSLIGVGIDTNGYIDVSRSWKDDLFCPHGTNKEWDIVRVGVLDNNSDVSRLFNNIVTPNVIWERSEKKKYTYAQLKEILGEEFEIVL